MQKEKRKTHCSLESFKFGVSIHQIRNISFFLYSFDQTIPYDGLFQEQFTSTLKKKVKSDVSVSELM